MLGFAEAVRCWARTRRRIRSILGLFMGLNVSVEDSKTTEARVTIPVFDLFPREGYARKSGGIESKLNPIGVEFRKFSIISEYSCNGLR